MYGMAVADGYLDYNAFHDVKIPKVPGRRAIKVATPEQFLKVRACLPTKPAQVFSTLLVSSGLRFCEATGLQPADFDFEAGILEVAQSVVKVSRQHHPQGKTFLVRDYTNNGQTRRLKLDGAVVEFVRGYVTEHGIGSAEVMFPAELTKEQLGRLGIAPQWAGGSMRMALWAATFRRSAGARNADSGPATMGERECASGERPSLAICGAGGRSLVMKTRLI
jgi:integrase